jgi:hypothetical protein
VEDALVQSFEGVFDSQMIVQSFTRRTSKPGAPRIPLKSGLEVAAAQLPHTPLATPVAAREVARTHGH